MEQSLFSYEFEEQFSNLILCCRQSPPSEGRCTVDPTAGLARSPFDRAQVSPFFEPMQNRVERARTDPIAMSAKFFEHGQAKYRFFGCMMENVKTDQPGVQLSIVGFGHSISLRSVLHLRQPDLRAGETTRMALWGKLSPPGLPGRTP